MSPVAASAEERRPPAGVYRAISSSAPDNLGVNDFSVAANSDFSAVAYGLAGGSNADNIRTWWLWREGTKKVTEFAIPRANTRICDVSEDGRYVLYTHRAIHIYDTVTETTETAPVPSPDASGTWRHFCGSFDSTGTRVAYARMGAGLPDDADGDESRVLIWDRASGETAAADLPEGKYQIDAQEVSFSRDGTSVIYQGGECPSSSCDGKYGLFVGLVNTATMRMSYALGPRRDLATWEISPDHTALAWTSVRRKVTRVWLRNVASGKDRRIAVSAKYDYMKMAGVSNRGRNVLYEEFYELSDDYGREAKMFNSESGRTRTLMHYTDRVWTIPQVLSDDGRKILYSGIKPLRPRESDGLRRDAYIWSRH